MSLDLKKICHDKILVFDGAMGTSIQQLNLSSDDFREKTGCSEILNLSKPKAIQEIHASFFDAGCDVVETNTFGANGVVLSEYGLTDKIYEINRAAAELARQVATDFSSKQQQRYVAGSIGPGTKLPSLRQTQFDQLRDAYLPQVEGLIDGGADLLIVETCQDILQLKTVLITIFEVFQKKKIRLPVIAQVTMETNGKTLVGSDMLTVIVTLSPFPIDALGINCSTGPKPMAGHLKTLATNWDRLISVMPNAGMPRVENGAVFYDLSPKELATHLRNFITDLDVNIVGGCCGTTPEHLRAVSGVVSGTSPQKRVPEKIHAASSLYGIASYRVEPKPLIIGERCNASGSKKFRDFLLDDDMNGLLSIAHQQEKEGAHLLDVSTAYVGLDEKQHMAQLVEQLNTDVSLPLMIDSTKPEVIENALQRIAGKAIVNSVNLENEDNFRAILKRCKQYGAAVIGLTIDEKGMAKTADHKCAIAQKMIRIITQDFEIPAQDIFIDTLTFTLGSGDETTRNAAVETMQAIRQIKSAFPDVNTILGVSNVSYGLKPHIRQRLNSVFLFHAIKAGLDAAILHAGKILPLYQIPQAERELLEKLIFNRQHDGRDPLLEVIHYFEKIDAKPTAPKSAHKLSPEQRLEQRIIDGNAAEIESELEICLKNHSAIDIINQILLKAMKRVGEFFGSGEMQLPFVLKSAETMKAAVRFLQPHLDKSETKSRGKIVLATVSGDVHDIGKNLVDIILSNNGYEVINLGVKQPIEAILEAFRENNADAIGMSGLLVKSTLIMEDNLKTMKKIGLSVPVLLGGAALSQKFVENDLRKSYGSLVFYAKDAFDGLKIMDNIVAHTDLKKPNNFNEFKENKNTSPRKTTVTKKITPVKPPVPPFWGKKIVSKIPLKRITPFINKKALFRGRWQVKGQQIEDQILEPKLKELIELAENRNSVEPAVVYGYFPCQSKDNSLLIYSQPNNKTPLLQFNFPRQTKKSRLCIANYFLSDQQHEKDLVAFQIVTIGHKASEESKRLFKNDKFQDYLYWHGFTVELAEALAEYWHQQIRLELGINKADAQNPEDLFKGHYQGARFSLGYSACPNLKDQEKIFRLLKPEEIGMGLTENYQLVPEQSTSAIIVHHPQARYFNI